MSSENKIGRTIRLDPEIDTRLKALCRHIGTNPNAYLVTEIGKAISRDEVALKVLDYSSKNQADFFERLLGEIQGQGSV